MAEKHNKSQSKFWRTRWKNSCTKPLIDSIFSALPPSWFSDGRGRMSLRFGRSGVSLPSDQLFFLSHCSSLSLVSTNKGFAVVALWADLIWSISFNFLVKLIVGLWYFVGLPWVCWWVFQPVWVCDFLWVCCGLWFFWVVGLVLGVDLPVGMEDVGSLWWRMWGGLWWLGVEGGLLI